MSFSWGSRGTTNLWACARLEQCQQKDGLGCPLIDGWWICLGWCVWGQIFLRHFLHVLFLERHTLCFMKPNSVNLSLHFWTSRIAVYFSPVFVQTCYKAFWGYTVYFLGQGVLHWLLWVSAVIRRCWFCRSICYLVFLVLCSPLFYSFGCIGIALQTHSH